MVHIVADRLHLWGIETERAVANFTISGEPFPADVIRWLARLKSAAASVNADLGLLSIGLANEIRQAAESIEAGKHNDQFPVDVFQTGSGTSTNMNMNEVISTLTDHRAHPNDHVNLGQSSNDVMPTAVQLAACESITSKLLPATRNLAATLRQKGTEFSHVVKPGRTHLMDALPVLMGDEFDSYAAQIDDCTQATKASLEALARVPLGGTAVGTGVGTVPDFAERVIQIVTDLDRLGISPTIAISRLAAQASHDSLVATSATLNTLAVALTKICNDLRWMASGPKTGLGEITIAALQKGSSIMPGKVNPVVPEIVLQVAAQVIGNHVTITVAGMQGNFELNVMLPVMTRNLLQSINLLAASCDALANDCVATITVNESHCRQLAIRSSATATVLNRALGYDTVEQIVREAERSGRGIQAVATEHGVSPELIAEIDIDRVARVAGSPSPATPKSKTPASSPDSGLCK